MLSFNFINPTKVSPYCLGICFFPKSLWSPLLRLSLYKLIQIGPRLMFVCSLRKPMTRHHPGKPDTAFKIHHDFCAKVVFRVSTYFPLETYDARSLTARCTRGTPGKARRCTGPSGKSKNEHRLFQFRLHVSPLFSLVSFRWVTPHDK